MITKFEAIKSLRSNSSFEMDGDVIKFLDGVTTAPTEAEIQTEIVRLQAEYDAKEYQRKRAAEYPNPAEYLDGVVKGDQAQIDKYIADCLAIKKKYPKGVK
jgi:hypothetical protein